MTTLPPPQPSENPSGTTSTFPPPTGAQIVRGLRAPIVGYGWLLLGAVAMVVLIVVAANIGSTGDQTGVDSGDTNAIGVLIGMPFQIAGMALLGSLHFTEHGARGSLFLPPLLLTVLYLVMTARAARRTPLVPAAGTRALLGVIVGFVAAVVVTPLTWALAMRDHGAALHSASVSLFFGIWALTGLASYLGASRAAGAVRPAWIPSDYAAAARLWLSSLAVWVVVAIVVLTVVAVVKEDLWVGILSPLWGVTVSLYTYAIAHFGSLSFGGEGLSVGDLSMMWTIVMVVGALALAVLTSVAWHLRRDTRTTSLAQPGSWAVLPATYAVGGILVWLVPSVVLGGGLGEVGASATLQPAYWVAFVFIGWGAAIEALSRFVAPSLVQALPSRLHNVLGGPEPQQVPPLAPGYTGEDLAAVQPRALTAEERARYKKMGIAAGVLVALALAGWITVSLLNSQVYGPKDQASTYMDAVVAADLTKVNDLAPTSNRASDALMTTKIYTAAAHRASGYKLGDLHVDGDTATVEVRLKGSDTSSMRLTLKKDGHTNVFFNRWKVADGGLARAVSVSMPDGAGHLSVNNVPVDQLDSDLWMLPGDYVFDAFAGNQWLTSPQEPVTITSDDDQAVDVPAAVASDAFKQEVQRHVDAYLATCMASTELEPANCPNAAYAGGDVRNVKWTMDQAPTLDFDSFDGTFPADLSYGDPGHATVTYESDESYGFGAPDWQPQGDESDLYLSSVTVTQDGDGLGVSISSN